MRLIYILALLLLPGAGLLAQNGPKDQVKQAAINMGTALLMKNYDYFVHTMYPAAIAQTPGGVEKMIGDLQRQMEAIEKQGTTIKSMWPGEPSDMIDTAGELQCTIPQFMKMRLHNGMLTTQTTLIGISPDNGKRWYFIDAVDRPLDDIRKLFPTLSSKLVIPPSAEPEFVSIPKDSK